MLGDFGASKRPTTLPTAPASLQALYLARLARLVRKVGLHRRYLVPTDRRMQLLNRAILSTFDDCRTLGVEAEARDTLAGLRRPLTLPAP